MDLQDEPVILVGGNDQVARLIINRPKALNALNPDVLHTLILTLEKISQNPALRVVILSGSGEKAFAAGADIQAMRSLGPRPIAEYVELGQRALRTLESFKVPVIGAVNGYALGGGLELALACDILIASKTAKLGQPEINLGIIPGFGGTQRLIDRCGIGTARRLVLTGEIITAEVALSLGLVDQVVEATDLTTKARVMADLIATKAPLAVQRAKRVMRESMEPRLLSGMRLEVEAFLELFKTADREEGMDAFLQKREAKFTGK